MGTLGFVIIGLYLVGLVAIGYYCSGRQESISDFFVAGRNIPTWAALAAIVATETSAVTYIGAPARSFAGDFSFLQVAFGFILARILLAIFFLPKFFERELVTIYEYLGYRFGRNTQRASGLFFFVTRALAAGVRHYAAALVISSITPFDLMSGIVVTGVVSLVYSIIGGLSAVIWTEVVQFSIMIIGSLLAFIYLIQLIPGGWEEVVVFANQHNKFDLIHWDWSASGGYSFFLGISSGLALSLATHGADQDTVQRLLSCRNLKSARIAVVGSGLVVFAQFAFFLLIGVMLFVYYKQLPEGITKADELFPYFVSRELPPAAGALVIAAILSAALSSTASALNSLSSTSVNDFVKPWFAQTPDNQTLVLISRFFTLFWTIVLVVIAALAKNSAYILDTGLSIPSYTYGSLLAAFLLGIFTPIKSQRAIITGMIFGVLTVIFMAVLQIHWTSFVPSGTAAAMLIAWIFDTIGKHYPKEVL